jgi:hypothetical protein
MEKVPHNCAINGRLFKYMDELSRKEGFFFVIRFVASFVHLTLRRPKGDFFLLPEVFMVLT